MFDFGLSFSHIMVIVILAVIVIGPKDLPVVLRKLGQGTTKLRSMARDFQGQVDAAMKDSGMHNVRQDLASLATGVSAVMAPMQTALIASATALPKASLASASVAEAPALYTPPLLGAHNLFADGQGETRLLGKSVVSGSLA